MIARVVATMTTVLLAFGLVAASASAADWHSEQPLTPGSDVPVTLGTIYDIAFWAPNRGVLITGTGVWAYDGATWHQYATVCGGTNGKVVWAGPTEFWTISDQPLGQANPTGEDLATRSLCHFAGGAVVASYAQPVGQAGSYLPMHGGACLAPDDCWFGGERLVDRPNTGAFHLHWDGTSLTPWPSLQLRDPSVTDPDRAVADVVTFQGAFYESARVDGNRLADEDSGQPYLLHLIQSGTPPAFTSQFPIPSIDYGAGGRPEQFNGLMLSGDDAHLWGIAGGREPAVHPVRPIAVRVGPEGYAALPLRDPDEVLKPAGFVNAIAAEPGTDSAWVAYAPPGESGGNVTPPARLARVHGDGTVEAAATLPSATDGIARKGSASTVACAAFEQCWMAAGGWLFHYGDALPRDDEPAMHRLITYRPSDAATTIVSPDTLPDDNSGIAPPVFDQPPPEPYTPLKAQPKAKALKLVTRVGRRLIKGTTLKVTFTLAAKAKVQLLAKRKKTVVARTKRRTLAKGRHTLTLKLSRKRWPTALDLRADLVKKDSTSDTPQAGDGVDSEEADDILSSGTATISSVPRSGR